MNVAQKVKVGCCGFPTAQKKYFELFTVVEIQKTFYQIPEIKTAEMWRNADKELETLRKKITRRTSYVMFDNSTMKEDALRFLDVLKA